MIEWRQCTEDDIDAVVPYGGQLEMLDTLKKDLSHAVTMLVDDEPIAAAGAQILYDGFAEVWALLSDDVLETYPMALTRKSKRWLDEFQAEYRVVRVQSVCPDSERHRNWLKVLGFEEEGLMRSMGPGGVGDFWMCGRIRQCRPQR